MNELWILTEVLKFVVNFFEGFGGVGGWLGWFT